MRLTSLSFGAGARPFLCSAASRLVVQKVLIGICFGGAQQKYRLYVRP